MGNFEIRLHGRGGQGAVSAADMLVAAFTHEGKHAAGFPVFGSERRGAPTQAFVRFGDEPVREKTKIYHPHCVWVFDPMQIETPTTYAGLQQQGTMVSNVSQPLTEKPHENLDRVGTIKATPIAMEILGIPAVSTCMLGAFAATTQWVELASILAILPEYFKGKILDKNIVCVERGFKETAIFEQ
jgi:2-oxoacid:acceptor oxidoreductase gamma subunit (pyruvate/2-ketoisovalerate family)